MLCNCPKLTPLQSRLLASIAALGILALIYWTLSDSHFAYAAELAVDGAGWSRSGEDHNWHRIAEEMWVKDGIEMSGDEGDGDSDGISDAAGAVLVERAPAVSTIAGNNAPNSKNIRAGETQTWEFSRRQLFGRHGEIGAGLPANAPENANVEERHLELRKRDEHAEDDGLSRLEERQGDQSRTIYVSINTCLQPNYVGSGTQSAAPPQLSLYVSTSADNRQPGRNGNQGSEIARQLNQGYAQVETEASDNWYMSVHAPSLPDNFTGAWNYELAVSIDDFYHSADLFGPNLFLVDSDTTGALLVTNNLTQANASQPSFQAWMDLTAPYILFANNADDTRMMGISNSYCGWSQNAQVAGEQDDPNGDDTNVQMQMTTRGLGNKPKEQFYVTNLNRSSSYRAVLARPGNSSASGSGVVGGGGKVWGQGATFATKSDGNCNLLFNLDFCDEVAYAVPSHPDVVRDFEGFQDIYDNYARFFYQRFNYSLQQIPCNTVPEAQYSLARNCDDCARAYKEWLCAVSIPRCEDFTSIAPHLQVRNVGQDFINGTTLPDEYLDQKYVPMHRAPTLEGSIAFDQTLKSSVATNQSRNVEIDRQIKPGPYKEVLPCEDLCYTLVQSCPAALGFGCPSPGKGLERSYGNRDGNNNGTLSCSYLGAYVYTDAAPMLAPEVARVLGFAVMVGLALVCL